MASWSDLGAALLASQAPNERKPAGPIPLASLAEQPSLADAWGHNTRSLGDWIGNQRAISSERGLWGDQGMTPAGARDTAQQVAMNLAMGSTAPNFRAFHGSPHSFKRFDASKIGTGEGNQTFGRGMYFAENEATAQQYRDALTDPYLYVDDRKVGQIGSLGYNPEAWAAHGLLARDQNLEDAKQGIRDSVTRGHFSKALGNSILKEMDGMQAATIESRPSGHMYEVQINADPSHFLDWDKPLSQQPATVQQVLGYRDPGAITEQIAARRASGDNATADFLEAQHYSMTHRAEMKPGEVFNLQDPALTARLQEAGVPGIRYLDGASRDAGQGTSNTVVFDPSIIEILRKYGLTGLMAGAGAAGTAAGSSEPPT